MVVMLRGGMGTNDGEFRELSFDAMKKAFFKRHGGGKVNIRGSKGSQLARGRLEGGRRLSRRQEDRDGCVLTEEAISDVRLWWDSHNDLDIHRTGCVLFWG